MKFLILILLSSSCAQLKKSPPKDDLGPVIDLAVTSYIRGCVDGMNAVKKKRTYGKRLDQCKEMGKIHRKDIEKPLLERPSK